MGIKVTLVTKVSLSVDLMELHFLNQCKNHMQAHT